MLKQKTKFICVPVFLALFGLIAGYFYIQINRGKIIPKTLALKQSEPEVLGESIQIQPNLPLPARPKFISPNVSEFKNITAKSFLAYEEGSERNLFEQNSGQKLGIASLTKLLTGYTVYNNLDLNFYVQIKPQDEINIAPSLNLASGDEASALDLFNAMLIGSCNDAAKTLANETARTTGKNFVDLMNETAQILGMSDSHFSNPLGFDTGQNFSTAADLKKLVIASQKLGAFKIVSRRLSYSFTDKNRTQTYKTEATNKLLSKHPEIEAIKTGYTENSLGSMAFRINTQQGGFVVILLGSQDREGDALKLKKILLQTLANG